MSHDRGCWKCGADTMADKKECFEKNGDKCVKHSLFTDTKNYTLAPEKVIKVTARRFGIPEHLLSDRKNRTRDVAYARHLAMYVARQITFKSYEQIGKAFGYTPAAVVYGCKQIEKVTSLNKVKQDISALTRELK